MWAYKPWDNDSAADWYGGLMDSTKLREAWLAGIKEDPIDSPDVVRAAASLFIMLGHVYIWPINNLDDDLELTISQLEKVVDNEEYKAIPELIELISGELRILKSRVKTNSAVSTLVTQPWWQM